MHDLFCPSQEAEESNSASIQRRKRGPGKWKISLQPVLSKFPNVLSFNLPTSVQLKLNPYFYAEVNLVTAITLNLLVWTVVAQKRGFRPGCKIQKALQELRELDKCWGLWYSTSTPTRQSSSWSTSWSNSICLGKLHEELCVVPWFCLHLSHYSSSVNSCFNFC